MHVIISLSKHTKEHQYVTTLAVLVLTVLVHFIKMQTLAVFVTCGVSPDVSPAWSSGRCVQVKHPELKKFCQLTIKFRLIKFMAADDNTHLKQDIL